jgi:hypothetical protein
MLVRSGRRCWRARATRSAWAGVTQVKVMRSARSRSGSFAWPWGQMHHWLPGANHGCTKGTLPDLFRCRGLRLQTARTAAAPCPDAAAAAAANARSKLPRRCRPDDAVLVCGGQSHQLCARTKGDLVPKSPVSSVRTREASSALRTRPMVVVPAVVGIFSTALQARRCCTTNDAFPPIARAHRRQTLRRAHSDILCNANWQRAISIKLPCVEAR